MKIWSPLGYREGSGDLLDLQQAPSLLDQLHWRKWQLWRVESVVLYPSPGSETHNSQHDKEVRMSDSDLKDEGSDLHSAWELTG